MAVKTKSVFQPAEREDGYRILITRFYPRGVSKDRFDEWAYVLSPSPELLFAYKDGKIDWFTFAREFIGQLKAEAGCLEAIQTLHDISKNEEITLLCFERDGSPCHRHLVRDIIADPDLLERPVLIR
jgi:uncharacterized protein YeaO (DUF488 family)